MKLQLHFHSISINKTKDGDMKETSEQHKMTRQLTKEEAKWGDGSCLMAVGGPYRT